jgi:vacuolar-type H+-ATPase subunit I/STV1
MVSDLTDGLLVALISVIYFLIFNSRLRFPLIVLITLALLTRPSGPLLVALLLPFAFAYRKMSIYLGVAISIIGTLALAYVSPEAAGTQTSGEYTVYQRIQDFALHGIKVLVVEFGQLFVMDRILFVFIIVAIATAMLTWKNVYSQSFLSLLMACFAMGAWNGALGVNFRYQLPLIFAAALIILIHGGEIEIRARKLLQNRIQKTK